MNNYILEYYQAIKDGTEIVGRWIILLYEIIVHGLEKSLWFYDNKKAHKAIRFIENFCHHSKGRNDLIKLELWQKAFISVLFGVVDSNGLRQFREVLLIIGRKNGKSLLASAIMACFAYIDGEYGAEIYVVAPKLDQANITYSCFWETVSAEPELKALTKSRKSDIYIESTNTSIKKVAFNYKKADGYNPQLTVVDELEAWVGEGGKKQYNVFVSAEASREQPCILAISTAGYVNEGIYDELVLRGTRFLLGDSKEARFLPVLYMIDDVEKWNDLNELKKANPNLAVSVSIDYLLEEIAKAEATLSLKAEFLCKHCNIKQNSSQAFLSTNDVKKTNKYPVSPEILKSSYCVGGIDLSQTTDLTSACVLIEKDGVIHCLSHFWLPEERLEDAIAKDGLPYREFISRGWLSLSGSSFVDYQDVYKWFTRFVEEYEILPLIVGYDRYSSQYLIKDMQNYGFKCSDVYQGYNLTPAINEFYGLVKDGKFNIGDNDLLKVHLLNVAVQQDNESRRKKIVKQSPTEHIDGVAAILDALIVRQANWDEFGSQLVNK